jgi:hypothetical protein
MPRDKESTEEEEQNITPTPMNSALKESKQKKGEKTRNCLNVDLSIVKLLLIVS